MIETPAIPGSTDGCLAILVDGRRVGWLKPYWAFLGEAAGLTLCGWTAHSDFPNIWRTFAGAHVADAIQLMLADEEIAAAIEAAARIVTVSIPTRAFRHLRNVLADDQITVATRYNVTTLTGPAYALEKCYVDLMMVSFSVARRFTTAYLAGYTALKLAALAKRFPAASGHTVSARVNGWMEGLRGAEVADYAAAA